MCTFLQTDFYLSQVPSLTVLHCQQRQVIGGHKFLHSLWNLSGCNHIDMVQPERVKISKYQSERLHNIPNFNQYWDINLHNKHISKGCHIRSQKIYKKCTKTNSKPCFLIFSSL